MTIDSVKHTKEGAIAILQERAERHSKLSRECTTKKWQEYHQGCAGSYRDAISIVKQIEFWKD